MNVRPMSPPQLYNATRRTWNIDISDEEIKDWFIMNVQGPVGSPELFDFYDSIPGRWAFIHNNYGKYPWPGDCFAFETIEQVIIMKAHFPCQTINFDDIWRGMSRWYVDDTGKRFEHFFPR